MSDVYGELESRLRTISSRIGAARVPEHIRQEIESLADLLLTWQRGGAPDTEKARRIYYQDIVYAVCNQLDRIFLGRVVCGTVDSPSTKVQELMTKLADTDVRRQALNINLIKANAELGQAMVEMLGEKEDDRLAKTGVERGEPAPAKAEG